MVCFDSVHLAYFLPDAHLSALKRGSAPPGSLGELISCRRGRQLPGGMGPGPRTRSIQKAVKGCLVTDVCVRRERERPNRGRRGELEYLVRWPLGGDGPRGCQGRQVVPRRRAGRTNGVQAHDAARAVGCTQCAGALFASIMVLFSWKLHPPRRVVWALTGPHPVPAPAEPKARPGSGDLPALSSC